MDSRGWGLLVLLSAWAVGCATTGPDVAVIGPSTIVDVDPRRVQGPYVRAGTPFTVQLDQPLDTQLSRPGQAFTAHLQTPLVSTDGRMLALPGAQLRGQVVSTGDPTWPRLRLELQSIDTIAGPVRILAAVRHAQRYVYAGPGRYRPVATYPYYDPYIYPYDYYAPSWAYGGGPRAYDYQVVYPREIRMPQGAELQLVLTRPLLFPGTRVR